VRVLLLVFALWLGYPWLVIAVVAPPRLQKFSKLLKSFVSFKAPPQLMIMQEVCFDDFDGHLTPKLRIADWMDRKLMK
jgi:hypothetical protein